MPQHVHAQREQEKERRDEDVKFKAGVIRARAVHNVLHCAPEMTTGPYAEQELRIGKYRCPRGPASWSIGLCDPCRLSNPAPADGSIPASLFDADADADANATLIN